MATAGFPQVQVSSARPPNIASADSSSRGASSLESPSGWSSAIAWCAAGDDCSLAAGEPVQLGEPSRAATEGGDITGRLVSSEGPIDRRVTPRRDKLTVHAVTARSSYNAGSWHGASRSDSSTARRKWAEAQPWAATAAAPWCGDEPVLGGHVEVDGTLRVADDAAASAAGEHHGEDLGVEGSARRRRQAARDGETSQLVPEADPAAVHFEQAAPLELAGHRRPAGNNAPSSDASVRPGTTETSWRSRCAARPRRALRASTMAPTDRGMVSGGAATSSVTKKGLPLVAA